MNKFRPARKTTGRIVATFFSVAGGYDHIAFIELASTEVASITTDSKDLEWIKAIGGAEKASENQSTYST